MPRIDDSSLLHSYGHSGADGTSNVPANTNNKTTKSSPSTTVKSSLSDSNSASRDNVYSGTHLPRMPDTSENLERNWLTAAATPAPIFSRAGLPHVVMPVRADSRKAKDRPSTTGITANNNPTTCASATVSRGGEVIPDNKTKGIYAAAEEVSSTSASPGPEVVMQNNQQNFPERRHTVTEDRSKRTIASRDYLDYDDDDGKENQMPFPDSSKFAGGFTKLRRVLSLGGSASDDPTSSIQLQAHALIDNKDNMARSEIDALGDGRRSDKKWQLSSIFKFFSGGPNNKGSKVT